MMNKVPSPESSSSYHPAKHASEALVYIRKLYGIEKEMKEAGLESDAIQKRRQEESYRIIQEFENWMNSVSGRFTPKSRMGKALVYTYTLLPRLSRYVLDGRYHIDNNGVENAIRRRVTGRYYPLIAGDSRYYQLLAVTTRYYLGNGS